MKYYHPRLPSSSKHLLQPKDSCADCSQDIQGDYCLNDRDESICEDCYCNNYARCNSCNYIYKNEDSHWTNDASYCNECFYERYCYCMYCDEITNIDDYYNIENEGDACDYCVSIKGEAHKCTYCEAYRSSENMVEIGKNYYCNDGCHKHARQFEHPLTFKSNE